MFQTTNQMNYSTKTWGDTELNWGFTWNLLQQKWGWNQPLTDLQASRDLE